MESLDDMSYVEEMDFQVRNFMSMKEYGFWINAIIEDNIEVIQRELSMKDLHEKNTLLNGQFDSYEDLESLGIQQKQIVQFQNGGLFRPWCIVGAYGHISIMQTFIANEVDIFQKDVNNSNIIHAMVIMASLLQDREERIVKAYSFLKASLDVGCLEQLLHAENIDGLRPIELASHLGCFALLQAIFETEGIYLTCNEKRGIFDIQWFDVTDYESTKPGNRRTLSPLVLALSVDKRQVDNLNCKRFFTSQLVQNWVTMKLKSNKYNLLLWFLIRLGLLLLCIAFDAMGGWYDMKKLRTYNQLQKDNFSNTSFLTDYACFVQYIKNPSPDNLLILGCIILICSLCMILFDLVEMVKVVRANHKWRLMNLSGKKQFLVHIIFYRDVQIVLSIGILIIFAIRYFELHHEISPPKLVSDIVYAFIANAAVWSFLYFCQILPWIGSFVITTQRMVEDIIKFMVLFIAFLIPFYVCFTRLVIQNIRGECPKGFQSYFQMAYSTFTILFNMVNFSQFDLDNPEGIYTFHIIFIFLTAILLLNLLIAIFTNTAGYVIQHKDIIQTVQNLSVIWPCEDRVASIIPGLVHRQHSQNFVYDIKKDSFYVTRVQIRTIVEE